MSFFEIYYKDKYEFKNLELTLDRINNALMDADFNEKNLGKIIHIAGTNGKGSTAFFLSQILEKNNIKTALFTSPHIIDIKERISLYLENIDNQNFDRIFKKYENIIINRKLSYFEGIFFIAVMWFSENKPDVTILETGLGGRYDAANTNMINNKICLLTSISQDHADILGKNIYKIIDEKLAITRNNSNLILSPNPEFIKKYIKEKIKYNIIEITKSSFADNNYPFPYSENYSAAKIAAEFLINRTVCDIKGLLLPPCRLEKVNNIIFDGSHNPAGILSLIKSGNIKKNTIIIFSCTKERKLKTLYTLLSLISNNIILTTIPENTRSILKSDAVNIPCPFYENPIDAIKYIYKNYKKDDILITGSFYLCSYIKKHLAEL